MRILHAGDSRFGIKKADAAMREAEKADRKWNKIMGVPMPSLPGKRGGQRQVAEIIDFLGR